jgi:hypothetical protein
MQNDNVRSRHDMKLCLFEKDWHCAYSQVLTSQFNLCTVKTRNVTVRMLKICKIKLCMFADYAKVC